MNKKNYISVRDIAEDAKLNHEIAEEIRKYKRRHPEHCEGSSQNKKALFHWILRQVPGSHIRLRSARSEDDVPASKHRFDKFFPTLRMTCLLGTLFLIPTLAQAETCTATPDCASLGYTETSCPDGGVKCPWNTNLMYCCKKCAPSCEVKTCQIGDVLYGDKKCYTCLANALPDQIPIGVVFNYGKIVALNDLGSMDKGSAISACNSYSVGGVSGWYLPNNDELLAIYNNINAVQTGLQSGGSKLVSTAYWSSSFDGSHFIVNPVSGSTSYDLSRYSHYIRPVLAF